MIGRVTVILSVISVLVLVCVIFGSTILGSMMSPGVIQTAVRVDYFLNEYGWLSRLWRYTLYAVVFLSWPALGRKARTRDSHKWTDDDVRDWNGYRYRLLFILVAVDVAIIEQWFYRLLGLTA